MVYLLYRSFLSNFIKQFIHLTLQLNFLMCDDGFELCYDIRYGLLEMGLKKFFLHLILLVDVRARMMRKMALASSEFIQQTS